MCDPPSVVKAAQKVKAKTIRYTFTRILLILFAKKAYKLYKT
ncbi:hypothetical protein LEP1GSC125_2717 [Leptospira mayottensis 200901122]|uniref:Uncharacterized protein n=1 Tax=Leptospira mayottensis 200901122 TaxID=1193010 RepID=A0AA87MQN3_9LEPT|nr:hypothetical protein LEP1GSC125_2717 [Leptospira mayottensis 200901122]